LGLQHFAASPDSAKEIAGYFSLVTDIFLRMIKMIIAPWCSPPWWPASAAWAAPAR
jgi:L-cystine uptake protein TcyP (sodium:dicarboxylate symporter family)